MWYIQDDKWVRFILDQLISNAVKYRTDKLVLHFFTRKENDRVLLSVEDNGIGIPPGDLPRIFEKGFTGGKRTEDPQFYGDRPVPLQAPL